MAGYDISGLSWLNPQRTPGQALTSGVQAGSLIGASIQRAQEIEMERQAMPLKLQQWDLNNRLTSARIATEALENKERAAKIDAWMEDREKLSDWMALPDTEVMTATPPSVRSDIGMSLIAKRRKLASENAVVAARQNMEALNNRAAEYLLQRGVEVPQKTRPDGTPFYDQADIAAAGLKLDEREQVQLLDIWKQKGENVIAAEEERQLNRMDLENLKHMNRTELEEVKSKLSALKVKADSNIMDQARKALFLREADAILGDFRIKTKEAKTKALDELAAKFGISDVRLTSPGPTTGARPANPYTKGRRYGNPPMEYLGGDPNQRSSWR